MSERMELHPPTSARNGVRPRPRLSAHVLTSDLACAAAFREPRRTWPGQALIRGFEPCHMTIKLDAAHSTRVQQRYRLGAAGTGRRRTLICANDRDRPVPLVRIERVKWLAQ
jgi:hypothetical protein